jgi:hypothetical protein
MSAFHSPPWDDAIHSLPVLLEGYKNDYADVYRKFSNGAVSDNELYEKLIQTYNGYT